MLGFDWRAQVQMSIPLYFHTLRHLKGRQVYGRIRHLLHRPAVPESPPPAKRHFVRSPKFCDGRAPSMISETTLHVCGREAQIQAAWDWNNPAHPRFVLYNLHYFDDLNSRFSDDRVDWQNGLIERWIAENPQGQGCGWEAYPLSLRVVNWIKWALRYPELSSRAVQSLAMQVRYLTRTIEFHILGNHLIANAKALIFAGMYFKGEEADRWRTRGLEILRTQLREQILADGGHFELSPMYHALVLEDILDIINILTCATEEERTTLVGDLRAVAESMLNWLLIMCHPDGSIALFGDAAFDVAPCPADLLRYADALSVAYCCGATQTLRHLTASGYCRIDIDDAVLFTDVGRIGPDYLPAHGHADVLSFELSLAGARFIVDSGVSGYGDDPERLRQKGTAAHNTVVIDGQNSSELWRSFRVARRARPFDVKTNPGPPVWSVAASHDGYRRLGGGIVHRRSWMMRHGQLDIIDDLSGQGSHEVQLQFHFHPDWIPQTQCSDAVRLVRPGFQHSATLRYDPRLNMNLTTSSYHPSFGANIANTKLIGRLRSSLPASITTTIDWQDSGR